MATGPVTIVGVDRTRTRGVGKGSVNVWIELSEPIPSEWWPSYADPDTHEWHYETSVTLPGWTTDRATKVFADGRYYLQVYTDDGIPGIEKTIERCENLVAQLNRDWHVNEKRRKKEATASAQFAEEVKHALAQPKSAGCLIVVAAAAATVLTASMLLLNSMRSS